MLLLDQADKTFLFYTIGGWVFLVVAVLGLRKRSYLQQKGTVVEGVVIRLEITSGSGGYAPVVRFLTPNQEWITATYDIATTPASFREGETVRVRFDPDDPHCFTILSDSSSFLLWLSGLIGVAIMIAGIINYSKV